MAKLFVRIMIGLCCFSTLHTPATAGLIKRNVAVFVGSIRGSYQLAIPSNSARLRATGRAGLFLTTLGLSHALFTKTEDWNGSQATAQGIVNAFAGTGPGVIEGFLDRSTTPSVASQHWNYTRADDWKAWASRVGWMPSIFLLNMNAHGKATTTLYTPSDIQDVLKGTKDIRSSAPYVKFVLPYISPNSGVYGSWGKDVYWSTARDLALAQGGFVIDVPVGYYLNNPASYQQVVQDQIIWAVQHKLIVGVLLSPCSTDSRDWIIIHSCSFSPDPHFMSSARKIVSHLESVKANPTMWLIDNYSEQSVSPYPGTDDRNSPSYSVNTILAVGLWIAENAKTTSYPQSAAGVE